MYTFSAGVMNSMATESVIFGIGSEMYDFTNAGESVRLKK